MPTTPTAELRPVATLPTVQGSHAYIVAGRQGVEHHAVLIDDTWHIYGTTKLLWRGGIRGWRPHPDTPDQDPALAKSSPPRLPLVVATVNGGHLRHEGPTRGGVHQYSVHGATGTFLGSVFLSPGERAQWADEIAKADAA